MAETVQYDWSVLVSGVSKGQLNDRDETNDATTRTELPCAANGTVTTSNIGAWITAQASMDIDCWRETYAQYGYDGYEFDLLVDHGENLVAAVRIGTILTQNY